MYSIVCSGLTKKFGDLVAVDGIDLNIREGEFLGFLGPNGAGKSTTIKMLCGLLRPTAGAIRIAGYDIATQPLEVKRSIGVLPEDINLYERLTGEEFLVFAGRMYGLAVEEARRRTADLLELMELTEAKDKLIVDYSLGMKKKTALAGALIHRPRVMFLDEPFNAIDPISVRAIRNVLRQLTEHGTTMFFTTHVMEVVERLCSRVAIIHRGRIVGEGDLADLRAKAEAGGDSSLEDIFIKLVEARVDEETLDWL
ncbi:MAG: ABC transporter ATP-binding protein [Armatimonadota bacterium]|nr:MAG: ABC transporter ATP-binding protein [Armatimonadota bacterium]